MGPGRIDRTPVGALRATVFSAAVVLFALVACSAIHAQEMPFVRVALPLGVSIEVPRDWGNFAEEQRRWTNETAEGMRRRADVGAPEHKDTLLFMYSNPEAPRAFIRVSLKQPLLYTQQDLLSITPHDLALRREVELAGFEAMEQHGGPQVVEMEKLAVLALGGKRAIRMSYTRKDTLNTPDLWQVDQYHVPLSTKLLILTTSYQVAYRAQYRPVLNRAVDSLRIER